MKNIALESIYEENIYTKKKNAFAFFSVVLPGLEPGFTA